MSHEAHPHSKNTSKTSTHAAFWFAIVLTVLFIAAVNFVKVESNDTEGHNGAVHTTEHAGSH
ncbi:MAG: hypothetical protein JSS78_06610 [Bacteroidetes bacterium]|nr:hypothetical protein [Bacteroidota bacterium]